MNTEELQTLADFVRWGASQFNQAGLFFGHGTDNAIDDAMILVTHALHLPTQLPDTLWQTRLTAEEKDNILALFAKRMRQRIPTAYLTHEAWFAGLRFYVNSDVLIPRSPLAELIENQLSPWIVPEQIHSVLDLCTGSGCIAIACALLALPEAQFDASDISPKALEVAAKNIQDYDLGDSVNLVESDLFAQLADKKYDLILCNPPYVSSDEMAVIPLEYQHEPQLGLHAEDEGLAIVERILRQAYHHLNPNGVLIVEVGNSQYALIERYPDIHFTWLTFQRGGEGIFLLTKNQLANLG